MVDMEETCLYQKRTATDFNTSPNNVKMGR